MHPNMKLSEIEITRRRHDRKRLRRYQRYISYVTKQRDWVGSKT